MGNLYKKKFWKKIFPLGEKKRKSVEKKYKNVRKEPDLSL